MTTLAMILISSCAALVILSGFWVARGLWKELFSPSSDSQDPLDS